MHSVGIGTSESNRKNAIEVMQNGDAYMIGVGGYNGTNAGATGVSTVNSILNSTPSDANMVHKTGDENIHGVKTLMGASGGVSITVTSDGNVAPVLELYPNYDVQFAIVRGIEDPETLHDAANKNYVDNAINNIEFTGVSSISGKTGDITLGTGLSMSTAGQLRCTVTNTDTKVTSATATSTFHPIGQSATGNGTAVMATGVSITNNGIISANGLDVSNENVGLSVLQNSIGLAATDITLGMGNGALSICNDGNYLDFTIGAGIQLTNQDDCELKFGVDMDGTMTVAGNVTAAGFYESSDVNLKKNIEPMSVDVDAIAELPKVMYNWKEEEDSDAKHVGTIAQEVEKIYPDLVSTNKDGIKSVDYAKLSIVALAAIDQLNERIKALEAKLA